MVHFLPDVVGSVVGDGRWVSGELGQGRMGVGDAGRGGHRVLDVSDSCMGDGTLEGIRQGSPLVSADMTLMARFAKKFREQYVGLLSDVGVVLHRDVTGEVFVVMMAGNPWGGD